MAGSEIYRLAERMERMTKRELQKFKSSNGLHSLILPTSSGQTRPQPPPRASKRNASQRTKPEGEDIKAGPIDTAMGGDSGNPNEVESNEVTRDMKLEFVSKIKKLTNQGLTSMVNKIKEVKAATINDLSDDKIQIRVDDFEKAEFL